jgi:hypothetical protein
MSTIKRQIIEIPTDKLKGVDTMFGRMMNMDTENIPGKFKDGFHKTKDASHRNFRMKGIFESYKIKNIEGDTIYLENGVALRSEQMAQIFNKSFELVFIVSTLYGYEELDEAEENMFLKLFLDSWGTAFIECGNNWLEQYIAMDLEDKGIYATHSFSPGQNSIPMEMQLQIFETLKPEEIGVTVNDKFMMHPKKSVSGIFGIQTEKIENRIRPCDLCEKRDTCPTAYA